MIAPHDWRGQEGLYGGKVVAMLADLLTATDVGDRLALASVWAEFTGAVVPGVTETGVEVLHQGRSTALVRATLRQDGRAKASAVAKFVAAGEGDKLPPRTLPPAPEVDDVVDYDAPWGRLHYDPKLQLKVIDQETRDGVLTTRAWLRVRPGHGDDLGVGGVEAVLLDLLPPGLFALEDHPAFVPTVDFAMHLNPSHRAEVGRWYWGEMRTEWSDGEFCCDTGEIRTPEGAFVARGTQNRRVVDAL